MRYFKIFFNVAIVLVGVLLIGSLVFYNSFFKPNTKVSEPSKTAQQVEKEGFFSQLKKKVVDIFTPASKKEEKKAQELQASKAKEKEKLISLLPENNKDFIINSKYEKGGVKGFLVITVSAQGREKAEQWLKDKGLTDLALLDLEYKSDDEWRAIPDSNN